VASAVEDRLKAIVRRAKHRRAEIEGVIDEVRAHHQAKIDSLARVRDIQWRIQSKNPTLVQYAISAQSGLEYVFTDIQRGNATNCIP
jgi:citrate synthase